METQKFINKKEKLSYKERILKKDEILELTKDEVTRFKELDLIPETLEPMIEKKKTTKATLPTPPAPLIDPSSEEFAKLTAAQKKKAQTAWDKANPAQPVEDNEAPEGEAAGSEENSN